MNDQNSFHAAFSGPTNNGYKPNKKGKIFYILVILFIVIVAIVAIYLYKSKASLVEIVTLNDCYKYNTYSGKPICPLHCRMVYINMCEYLTKVIKCDIKTIECGDKVGFIDPYYQRCIGKFEPVPDGYSLDGKDYRVHCSAR